MQHAGLQYGQGAANSHQSPPFAHADISQTTGGNTTSSLRQFRKKDGTEKTSSTDLNTSIETHIARVPPHNHFPARPNDQYYRYQHQYPDYNTPYKETPAPVKYSEIAETPPQPIQHVDHMPAALQKHKEVHKDFMDMCNISQQTHMKQNYTDNLTRQQSYPPDAASVHHQYLHKEPQVHPGYKPESQYQQYPQLSKYNMPSQCRKYPPPPPENDFLAKLQRINPSMARSIMSEHHIRESQTTYPTMDQSRMYPQNQRYYPPTHLQNNLSYYNQPYNYPSSCNYKHPDYTRPNQMVGGTQYPSLNPHTDRSISPRNIHMMNYGTSPQKISPNYSQYNAPEYAQHYQHRRSSIPQDYYQQTCRTNSYMAGHQISPEPNDNRGAGGGLRHFIENWAEEEATAEITPIFKENIRIHDNDTSNEQVFVISPSEIPQIENLSLVPTENGQYIIKTGSLDNSVVRIKETTESNGERTVNLQIVEATPKADCMLAEGTGKTTAEAPTTVPYQENQTAKDCDDQTKTSQHAVEPEKPEEKEEITPKQDEETEDKSDENSAETSVIVMNEVAIIKDMPLIDEDHPKNEEEKKQGEEENESEEEVELSAEKNEEKDQILEVNSEEKTQDDKEIVEDNPVPSPNKRMQRIFSVDDIINNIGSSPTPTRRNSLQLPSKETEEPPKETPSTDKEEENEEGKEETEYRNAISVEDDSVILEIGGAWVQLNINNRNGTKVLSVLPLSESLVIDTNGNYQSSQENESETAAEEGIEVVEETSISNDEEENVEKDDKQAEETNEDLHPQERLEDISTSEVIIGEESIDNDVFLDLSMEMKIEETATVSCEVITETKVEEISVSTITSNITTETKVDEISISKITSDITTETKIEEAFVATVTPAIPVEAVPKTKNTEACRKRDDRKRSKDSDERRKYSSKKTKEERKDSEERYKLKKTQKTDDARRKSSSDTKKENENERKKASSTSKKPEKKDISLSKKSEKKEVDSKLRKLEKRLTPQSSIDEDDVKKNESKKTEKKLVHQSSIEEKKQNPYVADEKKEGQNEVFKLTQPEDKQNNVAEEDINKKEQICSKLVKEIESDNGGKNKEEENRSHEEESRKEVVVQVDLIACNASVEETCVQEQEEVKQENRKREVPQSSTDNLEPSKESVKQSEEEIKEIEKPITKAAKKLYINEPSAINKTHKESRCKNEGVKKSMSKLEETVNKIKSLKEKSVKDMKKTSIKETAEKKSPKIVKKVTFNLETEVREISKEEIDRKKLSWEEYNSRKRKLPPANETEEIQNKIMEDTVTSTEDINDEVVEKVAQSIENAMKERTVITLKKSPPRMAPSNWEDDTPSPESPPKYEVMSTTSRKCIIDVNEFNIKPIESVSTPSPVSSSQFSYHSEDDSLQIYKDVVDSKLNSLNIKIPKITKPNPVERFSVLFDRFLNKASLNYEELEEVKKFIEIKRKMIEEKKLTYEVRGERDYKDLKLHFKKVPEKRKKKRFRNLYTEDSSDDSDSSRSEKGVGDYSVYQRDSQGVPKLIFKRKSGLPQPFVKLERSQAVELLAKKRKLY